MMCVTDANVTYKPFMLSVTILSVIMLVIMMSVIMLSVIMMSVIILSVIVLSVMAPIISMAQRPRQHVNEL